ncbi:hypothetical protein BgiBS90_010471, partial [Biomphalaria glabrata]
MTKTMMGKLNVTRKSPNILTQQTVLESSAVKTDTDKTSPEIDVFHSITRDKQENKIISCAEVYAMFGDLPS